MGPVRGIMKGSAGKLKEMPKRILIHTRALEIPGGKQSFLLALQDHFESEVTYFYYGARTTGGENIFRFLKRFTSDYLRFYRIVKAGDFDLVHINTSLNLKSYFRDSIFALISTQLKTKTLVYWHGWRWDFDRKIAGKITPYFRWTFGRADTMICLAEKFAKRLEEYGYKKPILTRTTLVEDAIFNYPEKRVVSTAKANGMTLLFLSRIEKIKGIYEVLDSYKALKLKYPDTGLRIAGVGSELGRVKAYVLQEGIPDVQFLGWIKGEQKIAELYHADIFLLPSYSEGMPMCVLEAMASGNAIITTNVGGLQDFFVEGDMGFFVKPKDSKDLREKLGRLLANEAMVKRQGGYNRGFAREKFTAKRVCKQLERTYEKLSSSVPEVSNEEIG